jgi:hypothetical protein
MSCARFERCFARLHALACGTGTWGLAAPILLAASMAGAAPPAADEEPRFDLTVGVWVPRLKGDAFSGGGAGARPIQFDEELSLRDEHVALDAELTARVGRRWLARLSGFDQAVGSGTTFARAADFGSLSLQPGDRVDSQLEISSVALELGAVAWSREGDEGGIRATPLLALRYLELDQEMVVFGGGRQSDGGAWAGFMAGLELHAWHDPPEDLLFLERVEATASAAVGPAAGGGGGSLLHARVGLRLFVAPAAAVFFGFQWLEADLDAGGYAFDGSLQGLVLSGSLRW